MSYEFSRTSSSNTAIARSRRGSLADNIVTISPCSSFDINSNPNIIADNGVTQNPEKNIDSVLLKMKEQLQNLGGRSVLKLYTMLNLERLLRETNTEASSRNALNDNDNGNGEDVQVPSTTSYNMTSNNSGSNGNNKVITLEASRTANSSFVGVVSSCASSLGISPISTGKPLSGTSKVFTNELFSDQPPPMRRGSMITPPKVSNDFNSYYKINGK
ncbi:hypothetical protein PIROE2DRAFT_10210 [Piromyces sp. E2]|nr:hypothetical protein PIROE2DRAFT_10210 [Piromyces sp. E2]|eukprot:OUM63307.1 hypothetical protein PIROE2DRAFT_10210 [Piromyces sp. E2]